MRTAEIHNECLRILERQRLKSFKGVKGKSQLFDLIPNLPLAAPVDAMHQVYLGVTKVMMQVIVDKNQEDRYCKHKLPHTRPEGENN